MTVNEFMKKFAHTPDIELTLFNERGETYNTKDLHNLTHSNDRIKLRWVADEPFTHAIPFNHAVIHRGQRVWATFGIRPIDNSVEGNFIEVVYG